MQYLKPRKTFFVNINQFIPYKDQAEQIKTKNCESRHSRIDISRT